MGIELSGKKGMGMRCWTGNGNGMGIGMISREWEGIGTTIVIPAHCPVIIPALLCIHRTTVCSEHMAKHGKNIRRRTLLA